MKMKKGFIGLTILGLFLIMSSCGKPPVSKTNLSPRPLVAVNFLVYLDGDNNLEEAAIKDINEMEMVGSSEQVNILVLVDRIPTADSLGNDWSTTRLYRIAKDTNPAAINSEVLVDFQELDMSEAKTLTSFLTFCHKYFPAQRTFLTIWNHGSGVLPPIKLTANTSKDLRADNLAPSKALCYDDTTGTGYWHCLAIDEVREALAAARASTGQKLSLINLDTCLTQMAEIAYEWRAETDYLVASEASIHFYGNDYQAILTKLVNEPTITAKNYASSLVDSFYDFYANPENTGGIIFNSTYSAVETAQLTTFAENVSNLAQVLNSLNENEAYHELRSIVKEAIRNTTNFADFYSSFEENKDLAAFANQLLLINLSGSQLIINKVTEIQQKAAAVIASLEEVIIHHREIGQYATNAQKASGLAVLLPETLNKWELYTVANGYQVLKWSEDTLWDDWLNNLISW